MTIETMAYMTRETTTHTRIYYDMNDSSDDDRNDDTDGREDSTGTINNKKKHDDMTQTMTNPQKCVYIHHQFHD